MKCTMEAWIKAFFIGLMFAVSTLFLLESEFAHADAMAVKAAAKSPQDILGIAPGLYRVPKEIDGKANGHSDDDDDGDSFCEQDSGYTVHWDNIVSKGPILVIGTSIPAYYGFNTGVVVEPQHAFDSAGCTYKHETKATPQHLSYDDWSECDSGVIRKNIEIKVSGDRLYYSMKTWFVPKKASVEGDEIEPSQASCVLVKQPEAAKPNPKKS